MDRNELRAKLNNLRNERFMSKIIDDVSKAGRVAGIDGWFDFIESEILKHHEVKPKLSIVTKRVLLDPFLDEAYECTKAPGFAYRMDPQMFEDFCHPFSDKRGKYLDELSDKQRTIVTMMHEDVSKYKRLIKQGQSTIEAALDNVIRKRASEKGSDTPE